MSSTGAVRPLKVLIAAGGTGGHLFPARHIGAAFKLENPSTQVEFIGNGRPLEAKIIDAHGFKRHVISTAGVKGLGIAGIGRFLLSFPAAVVATWKLLSTFKPDVVIGVGGYVTVVPLLIAALRGIPTMIHEAEIDPGMANAFLARFVKKISVSFSEATISPKSKVFVTGQPVRPEMRRFLDQPPHLPERPRKLLVVGGSLGAKGIDDALGELAPFLAARQLEILHQTRPENQQQVEEAYRTHQVSASVVTFIEEIDQAYAAADIIIARAGASTIMELTIVNRPVIFVPYPFAQGDHQTKNARVLEAQGKALIVAQGENFPARLQAALEKLLDPATYATIVNRPATNRTIDAANRIVRMAHEIVNRQYG